MKLNILNESFSVCKVTDYSKIDLSHNFIFTAKTDEEYSLVCPTSLVPDNTLKVEDGWRGMRIVGVLDFSLIGILSKIAGILANNNISIFAISTYNTDYIFVKKGDFKKAILVLEKEGYVIH